MLIWGEILRCMERGFLGTEKRMMVGRSWRGRYRHVECHAEEWEMGGWRRKGARIVVVVTERVSLEKRSVVEAGYGSSGSLCLLMRLS